MVENAGDLPRGVTSTPPDVALAALVSPAFPCYARPRCGASLTPEFNAQCDL
jgi:hypothetical protein